jgi:sugar/nucleoside kinase (ribokinase family)
MMSSVSVSPQVVVAGHICLDIIPEITRTRDGGPLLTPGSLTQVGPAAISTGGVVSNTGLALHRLGVPVRLIGKVGDDLLGRAVIEIVAARGSELVEGMVVSPGETTSYTVVISPPGIDRVFFHCPGANDTFSAADVTAEALQGARLFHFGYPPLMARMWRADGEELARLLRMAKKGALTTSLDMTQPDPQSAAGRADWRRLLGRVLPLVDVFLPSLEEILFMLDRRRFQSLAGDAGKTILGACGTRLLTDLSDELLTMGCAVVVLKLGAAGLYLRTSSDPVRWKPFGSARPDPLSAWSGRELLAPCFATKVVGTTGAGDCAIAGFLASLLRGLSPEATMTRAVAVGACNVERPDATSGVSAWEVVERRIADGWPRLTPALDIPKDWEWRPTEEVWSSPRDQK